MNPPPKLKLYLFVLLITFSSAISHAAANRDHNYFVPFPIPPPFNEAEDLDDELDDYDDFNNAPGDLLMLPAVCMAAKDKSRCESTATSVSSGLNMTNGDTVLKLHLDALIRDTKSFKQAADDIAKDDKSSAEFKNASQVFGLFLECLITF